ncbi:MAG: ATP-dependent metallopeptidase FtsH/Yme1/Tma family protein [Actinobacteria bacterium]|nr:ATP-dependent metallopeptidase FtsH/Yme1/Tma family protein [Actinomycetota bacterium]
MNPTPGRSGPPSRGRPSPAASRMRWIPWVVIGGIVAFLLFGMFLDGGGEREELQYSEFLSKVRAGKIESVEIQQSSGKITGSFVAGADAGKDAGKEVDFQTQGPAGEIPEQDIKLLESKDVSRDYKSPPSDLIPTLLTWGLFIGIIVLFWWWLGRRAQGQMAGLMNIGRSRGKLYTTDKPKTRFDDVAGYQGVKFEINEVVDFLKNPAKFKEIGARIPKGVLLVGPPGTGKTLIARAVAGEAGVPFISVSGSDFMEMFVGVGAARVRDLFESARKESPAIIFIDEIDSIGRKRGAGLGGGHDEREQTLNQLLSEMDGFETTEGIVMMAATNRPDILDTALLRPGRFDRQVLVPLPTQDERLEILKVHCQDKRLADDVELDVAARGTPGMSGADLSNLVNEAALHAARRGDTHVHREDFEAARDRVLMGMKRESMALSEQEKEIIAYHEGGHAVLAYVLPNADPVHKVTILPTGMALGVTQQLPVEEKHIYQRQYLEDSLAVRLGGRLAEELVFGQISTGAENDLVGCTELARKMVRQWGMSKAIGPMAWGSQGAVFLGEDLVHTRDYSDETARVIDEEVETILREQEDRARRVLQEHRRGLDALATALLERETVTGDEVTEIVDKALGRKAGGPRLRPAASEAPPSPNGGPKPRARAKKPAPGAKAAPVPRSKKG